MSWCYHDAIARASTRIELQEAMIRFSKLGFPVAHGKFLGVQYEDYIYIYFLLELNFDLGIKSPKL